MEPFRYHVYVCTQVKPEGAPCCCARGSEKVLDALRREIGKQGLSDTVQITTSGSLGLCNWGPNLVVYPEGIWYSGVAVEDVAEIVSDHFKAGRPVRRLIRTDPAELKTEIDTNKARYMAAMKAKDEAGIMPDDFLESVRAFQKSRLLLTAVQLDVFTAIGDGATAEAVANRIKTDPRATEMLLNALTAAGLLQKSDRVFSNGPVPRRYLMEGAPDDSRLSLGHLINLWDRWTTLTDCVREGTSVTYTEMVERDDDWTESFIAAMHKNASLRAAQVARTVDTAGVKRMLDVGGGSGAYSIAFAQKEKELSADIFDLPTVVPIAQRHIDEAGLSSRVKARVGDMRTDPLGEDYDLVLFSAIYHMHDPDKNAELTANAFAALNPGGRIVIQDFVLNSDKTSPFTAALFALNMLVGTPHGSSYSLDEYTEWLTKAGFTDVQLVPLMGPTALVTAVKPK